MTTNQQPTDLEQLRAIYATMTPGEWLADGHYIVVDGVMVAELDADGELICFEDMKANALGIVAIHNAMPSLFNEVAALRREVERMAKENDANRSIAEAAALRCRHEKGLCWCGCHLSEVMVAIPEAKGV
jgi:hypothetical protein